MTLAKSLLVGVAGVVAGAAAMHVLHAQTKPPAYLIAEIDVTDANLYQEYQAKGGPLYGQFGARFMARGGRVDAFAGDPPKRAIVAVFDSLEKAQAFRDSPAYQELIPVRDKSSRFRAYLLEGSPN